MRSILPGTADDAGEERELLQKDRHDQLSKDKDAQRKSARRKEKKEAAKEKKRKPRIGRAVDA